MSSCRIALVALFPAFLSLPAAPQNSLLRPPLEDPGENLLSLASSAHAGKEPRLEELAQLAPHNSFWSNLLTADADQDGRPEVVLNVEPNDGSAPRIEFFEADAADSFSSVHQLPFADGGLLAIGDVDSDGLADLFVERAIGSCNHVFERYEASAVAGFPSRLVWSGTKDGDVTDFRATIADVDQDGVPELVTTDNALGCARSALEVYRPEAGNGMRRIANLDVEGVLGNPVVGDFDRDGRQEIAVVEATNGVLLLFDMLATGALRRSGALHHGLLNAYRIAAFERPSPTDRPLLFLAGQRGVLGYRLQSIEAPADGQLTLLAETIVPSACGASIAQLEAGDLFGSAAPELVLTRLCGTVPVFTVDARGAAVLAFEESVPSSLELALFPRSSLAGPSVVLGTLPGPTNPSGATLVFGRQPASPGPMARPKLRNAR